MKSWKKTREITINKKGYFLILLLIPSFGFANFSGRVVNVIDGDTVHVLTEGKQVKVRLIGIDAPELGQPFGRRSKQNLLHLTAQKHAEVMTDKQDRFGRWLGTLIIAGKKSMPNRLNPAWRGHIGTMGRRLIFGFWLSKKRHGKRILDCGHLKIPSSHGCGASRNPIKNQIKGLWKWVCLVWPDAVDYRQHPLG